LESCTGDDEPQHLLSFSSDFLVEKQFVNAPDQFPLTPLMANLELVSDGDMYHSLRNLRRRAADVLWPSLQRANTHRLRGDFTKFKAELKSIDADKFPETFDSSSMPEIIVEALETFEALFTSDYEFERELVAARIAEAGKVEYEER
jgi:hypothetical protein